MPTIERILCAVELRLADAHVLACACAMARPFGARVEALLVREGNGAVTSAPGRQPQADERETAREAELLFAELLASAPGSRVAETLVGADPRVILRRAEECASDLIVLGLERLSAHGPARLATVADELSRAARCPVMTVPAGARTASVSRILLPVDFSTATVRAVEWTIALARRFSATVHVLHAVGSSALRDAPVRRGEPLRTTLERARGRLDELEQRLRAATVSCETSIVERGTTHAILACREQLDSDLVVMGVHHHGSDRVPASGMVATIRCRTPVPVLSMTTPDADDSFLLDDATKGKDSARGQMTSAVAAH